MLEGNRSPSESRSLVVLKPETAERPLHRVAPTQAAFLAHLIASARKLPQFSAKRRAVPQEADAAYQQSIALFSNQ